MIQNCPIALTSAAAPSGSRCFYRFRGLVNVRELKHVISRHTVFGGNPTSRFDTLRNRLTERAWAMCLPISERCWYAVCYLFAS
jgi:transcriptional regulator with GAF, ATPase, and Fis domain